LSGELLFAQNKPMINFFSESCRKRTFYCRLTPSSKLIFC
jgi:hypothetical protein